MNNLQVFNNLEFGEVRFLDVEGKPYAVGSDVARNLGYSRPNEAISRHCKGTLKWSIPTNGGIQEMLIIPESDIYRLIIKSKLPSAEKFEKWVMEEVLPQIRQTGGYIPVKENESEAEIMAKALMIAQKTLEKKEELLKQKEQQLIDQKPKVETYDRFIDKEHTLGFRELRKENVLKEVMRGNKFIGKTVKATAFAIRNGYAVTKDIETDYGTKTQDRFTMKCRDELLELFSA